MLDGPFGRGIKMSFNDLFRLSCHAVILNNNGHVLLLKQTYNDFSWGLPGGSINPGETIHEALSRECYEELGSKVEIINLTGVYFHSKFNSQVFIFSCTLTDTNAIQLSEEHSEYSFFPISELTEVQKIRVLDSINYSGNVVSRKF